MVPNRTTIVKLNVEELIRTCATGPEMMVMIRDIFICHRIQLQSIRIPCPNLKVVVFEHFDVV